MEVRTIRLETPYYFFEMEFGACKDYLIKKSLSGKFGVKLELSNYLKLIESSQVVW